MKLPENPFKLALRGGRPQIGLWVGLADAYVSELLASTGFDWLTLDAEHSPNDPRTILHQLQAIAPYPTHPVVRTLSDDPALLKQYLDIGAQTVLVPMVETAEQAARIVSATRYPPAGIRGVGSALRVPRGENQVENYLGQCEQELCVLVQVETVRDCRISPPSPRHPALMEFFRAVRPGCLDGIARALGRSESAGCDRAGAFGWSSTLARLRVCSQSIPLPFGASSKSARGLSRWASIRRLLVQSARKLAAEFR